MFHKSVIFVLCLVITIANGHWLSERKSFPCDAVDPIPGTNWQLSLYADVNCNVAAPGILNSNVWQHWLYNSYKNKKNVTVLPRSSCMEPYRGLKNPQSLRFMAHNEDPDTNMVLVFYAKAGCKGTGRQWLIDTFAMATVEPFYDLVFGTGKNDIAHSFRVERQEKKKKK
ncbi:hypothetical protein BJ138DRAFT_1123661 [Hygrophoropsis aurantiaca]|uniref:Uncharacterized protein n=1 Tax=Hygrophoropsis aurantiaca TaxID=72124 RepID=A0ACB8AMN1_9AGAM|nr:hypothetical protein BJ138DRAFT_1123661 [Hygrophoropsis aurantiaca]